MNSEIIKMEFGNSTLLAVPAVHNHHVFATAVNDACAWAEQPIDAIAVELGPRTAAAAWRWIGELVTKSGDSGKFPVLLGLMKKNRVIHPEFREKAVQFQLETCKALHELPPEVIYREFGCAEELLCLSPTDSIIEAMRCAHELDIPLYGIDLEESAHGLYNGGFVMQDPLGAPANFPEYVLRNARITASGRDVRVDARRELAMAARLKGLLEKHGCILFTCGIGHWSNLVKLLKDQATKPSFLFSDAASTEPAVFRRVCLHPLIAINFTDMFPAMVKHYEEYRTPPAEKSCLPREKPFPDPAVIFDGILKTTYDHYFLENSTEAYAPDRQRDLDIFHEFERYLGNLGMLKLARVSDLFTTVNAAKGMMSRGFVRALVKEFLDYPWTTPDDHPECGLLCPNPDPSASGFIVYDHGYIQGEKVICSFDRPNKPDQIQYAWEWLQEKRKGYVSNYSLHTWIPWEYIITGLSFKAIQQAKRDRYAKTAHIFEGQIMEGIDIKKTLRSFSRGKEDIYIRESRRKSSNTTKTSVMDWSPVVWILDTGEDTGCEWSALYEDCNWMNRYVKDPEAHRQIIEARGDKMIAIIAYGNKHHQTPASQSHTSIRSDLYHGILIYSPICWSRPQFTRWVEMTGYNRNPLFHYFLDEHTCINNLVSGNPIYHDVETEGRHWSTAMILMSLPFAKSFLPVVVPDGYHFDPLVFEKAKSFGVDVCPVPLSVYSSGMKERLAVNHMVPALVNDPACVYEQSIIDAIGEKLTDYRHLVPRECLEFGM